MPRVRAFKLVIGVSLLTNSLIFTSSLSAWSAPKNLYLAYQGSLSGEAELTSSDQLKAIKFAIDRFNNSNVGKFRVHLLVFDDLGEPLIAHQVAQDIASDTRIIGVIGPSLSTTTISAMPIFDQSRLSVISPSAVRDAISPVDSTSPSFSLKYFHRVVGTDRQQANALLKLARHKVLLPKLLVVHHQNAYSSGLANNIKSIRGNDVIDFDAVPENTTNWSGSISKISNSKVNSVIYIGYWSQAAVFIRQLKESGYEGVITLSDGSLSPSLFQSIPKSLLEGIRLTGLMSPLHLFNRNLFVRIFGNQVATGGLYSLESLDATNTFLECIKKGASSRKRINVCLNRFSGRSITGKSISFTSDGDLIGDPITRFEVRKGEFQLLRN